VKPKERFTSATVSKFANAKKRYLRMRGGFRDQQDFEDELDHHIEIDEEYERMTNEKSLSSSSLKIKKQNYV
jgi:hypothetical protein